MAAPHANSIILVGPAALLTEYKALIARLDVDLPTGRGHLHAVPLQYLKADEAAKSLSALLEKSAAKAADGKGIRRISVESSPANNALLVDASPNDFETVRALLEQLDRAPEQVHIRVLIAEVSASAGFTWGVGLTALTAPGDAGDTAVSPTAAWRPIPARWSRTLRGVLPQGLTAAISTPPQCRWYSAHRLPRHLGIEALARAAMLGSSETAPGPEQQRGHPQHRR